MTEFELMEDFKGGGQEAFKYLFSALHDPLIGFTRGIIRDNSDACYDIVAEAFLKLWKNRERMESFDHIRRYIYVITRNAAIDELRLFTRKQKYQKEESANNTMSFDTYEMHALANMILMAMFNIKGKVRSKVMRMVYKGDKTTAEIADTLGISGQTVLNHKTRAIEEIRRILKPTPKTIHQEIQRTFAALSGL